MKSAVNLLPPQFEKEKIRQRKKTVVAVSFSLIVIFLFFNFFLFGTYFFLRKNATDSLLAIAKTEDSIRSLNTTAQLYANLSQKLLFLTKAWRNQVEIEKHLNYLQTLWGTEGVLESLTINKFGQAQLTLIVKNSSDLENFLLRVEKEKEKAKISQVKIISTLSNEELGSAYRIILSFSLPKSND